MDIEREIICDKCETNAVNERCDLCRGLICSQCTWFYCDEKGKKYILCLNCDPQ